MRPTRLFIVFLSLALLAPAAACAGGMTTLVPRSDQPIYLPPASQGTLTPLPSPTPEISSSITLGEEQTLPQAFFAFKPVTATGDPATALTLAIGETYAQLSSPTSNLFFELSSQPAGDSATTDACLQAILSRMQPDISNLQSSPAGVLPMPGGEGLQLQINGTLHSLDLFGELAVRHTGKRCFSLLGLAYQADPAALWQRSGQPIQQALLHNLRFLEDTTPVTCGIATDPTYGTTPDNPIQVGNINLYDGRTRIESYLLTLRGPGGEEILFSRKTPERNDQGVVIDLWETDYSGSHAPQMLYFDIYTYAQPLAVAGYTCEAPFPITAP